MSHLQRWSRRKRGVTGDEADEATAAAPAAAASEHAEAGRVPSDAPVAPPQAPDGDPEADLPDPDSLPPGSDITAFMAPGVSAGLRRRALKRLFAADHYGIRDGLDDYDQDFRRTLTPLASQAAERLRRWLDEPARGRDDGAPGEATPSPDAPPREAADADAGQLAAAAEAETPASAAEDALLDEGPLAENGKATKT